MDLSNVMNCNKIKSLNIKAEDIAAAVKDSTEVEVSEDLKQIRRKGAKAVPALTAKGDRKRDAKAQGKEEDKNGAEENEEIKLDSRGMPIFVNADFENPIIIHFKTTVPTGEEFKVNWKDIETVVRADFPKLKIVYSRADPHEGDLALSSHRANQEEVDRLISTTIKAQGKDFVFSKTAGEELKDFWQKQGGHF